MNRLDLKLGLTLEYFFPSKDSLYCYVFPTPHQMPSKSFDSLSLTLQKEFQVLLQSQLKPDFQLIMENFHKTFSRVLLRKGGHLKQIWLGSSLACLDIWYQNMLDHSVDPVDLNELDYIFEEESLKSLTRAIKETAIGH